ncbi:peptidyl-prolyl cis-trans isomerase [Nitzschia inconspicua]|uniref:peptidylprolyl isomerase n=1 Tax=Nitzschia inconspicua TaxID=303405 RepID=A0A9K3LPD6_9STRA|nr:peptidylprolyl isomerase [Nitzschia inconspicua]KAG7366169.1 peptidyl-prolyl cis-trans isomerase [Nitzschia inconspicua]
MYEASILVGSDGDVLSTRQRTTGALIVNMDIKTSITYDGEKPEEDRGNAVFNKSCLLLCFDQHEQEACMRHPTGIPSRETSCVPQTNCLRRVTQHQNMHQPWLFMILAAFVLIPSPRALAFTPSFHQHSSTSFMIHATADDNDQPTIPFELERRDILRLTTLGSVGAFSLLSPQRAIADDVVPDGITPTKTESGLKYFDLETGGTAAGFSNDETPKYGQLCVISYSAYMKLPAGNTDKQKFDSTKGYVIKHGNGKMIAGLDEGLHTMKQGGLRRIIIPPKLGFVSSGLGPLPEYPWQRFKLNSLIDQMIAQRGGNLIYDVRLERFFDDEADQGYYEDLDILPEERAELELRLMKRKQGETPEVLDAVGEDINITDRPKEKPIV